MKKLMGLIMLILSFSVLTATIKDNLYQKATEDTYNFLESNFAKKESILISDINDTYPDKFLDMLLSFSAGKNKFDFMLKRDMRKALSENIESKEASFDQSKKTSIGKFIPPHFLLEGKIEYKETRFLLKPIYNLDVNLKIMNVETGTSNFVFVKNYQEKWKPSIFLILMIIAVFYVDLLVYNRITKGYHAKKAFFVFLTLIILIMLWFFV